MTVNDRLMYGYKLPTKGNIGTVGKYILIGVSVLFIVELFTKDRKD